MTLFCYIVEEYQNAKMYLQSFMEETDNKTDTYYTNVLKYFECLEKGMTLEAISKIIPQDIIHSFSSAEQVFSEIELPNCPDCNNCSLNKKCKTKSNFILALRIAEAMKEHALIDQSYLNQFISK